MAAHSHQEKISNSCASPLLFPFFRRRNGLHFALHWVALFLSMPSPALQGENLSGPFDGGIELPVDPHGVALLAISPARLAAFQPPLDVK